MNKTFEKMLDAILTNDQVKPRKSKRAPKNTWATTETKPVKQKTKKKPGGTLKLKIDNFKFGSKKKTKTKTKKRGKK